MVKGTSRRPLGHDSPARPASNATIMVQMTCMRAWLFLLLGFGTVVVSNQAAAENATAFICGQEGTHNSSSTQQGYNRISFKVMDASGACVPHAHITVVDQVLGAIDQKYSDASGRAEFLLPRGAQFKAIVTAEGFKAYAETFKLESDIAKTVTLRFGDLASGPVVGESSAELIPLDRQPLMVVIPQQQLELLPPPARPIRHNHRHWL